MTASEHGIEDSSHNLAGKRPTNQQPSSPLRGDSEQGEAGQHTSLRGVHRLGKLFGTANDLRREDTVGRNDDFRLLLLLIGIDPL